MASALFAGAFVAGARFAGAFFAGAFMVEVDAAAFFAGARFLTGAVVAGSAAPAWSRAHPSAGRGPHAHRGRRSPAPVESRPDALQEHSGVGNRAGIDVDADIGGAVVGHQPQVGCGPALGGEGHDRLDLGARCVERDRGARHVGDGQVAALHHARRDGGGRALRKGGQESVDRVADHQRRLRARLHEQGRQSPDPSRGIATVDRHREPRGNQPLPAVSSLDVRMLTGMFTRTYSHGALCASW